MMLSFWKTKENKLKGLKLEISVGLIRVFAGYQMDTWMYSSHPFVVIACLAAMVIL